MVTENSIFLFTFGLLLTSIAVIAFGHLRRNKNVVIRPVEHFKSIIQHHPQWHLIFAKELFVNYKKYRIGHDIYELIFDLLNQKQLVSLVSELNETQRLLWKKDLNNFSKHTSSTSYLNFLIATFTRKSHNHLRRQIVAKLLSFKREELVGHLLSNVDNLATISQFIAPSFLKILLDGMGSQRYQKLLAMQLQNESEYGQVGRVLTDKKFLASLYQYEMLLNKEEAIDMNDLFLLTDVNKERLYYGQLYDSKKITEIFQSIQKKIPFDLLRLFPSYAINDLFNQDDMSAACYLDSYTQAQRLELYQKGALSPCEEINIENKIRINRLSAEAKFRHIQRSTNHLYSFCQEIPDWNSTFKLMVDKWCDDLSRLKKNRDNIGRKSI